jgi:hypothetical protein
MKTPSHTPGPWTATDTTTEIYNAVGGKIGEGIKVCFAGSGHRWHIADVYGQKDRGSPLRTNHGYAEANAALIAAAPDLLAALQALHEYTRTASAGYRNALTPAEGELYTRVHEAIRKATEPAP